MSNVGDRFRELYAGDRDKDDLVSLIRKHIRNNYDLHDDPELLTSRIKHDFEMDVPPLYIAEAIDANVMDIRHIRYHPKRGVTNRRGNDRESIPPSVRRCVRDRDDGKCVRCGIEVDDLQLHHIIPLSQGGYSFEGNLAYLCDECHYEAHLGDTSTKRVAYQTLDEFWNRFCQQ